MPEFKNLYFKPHSATNKGIVANLTMGNGKVLSVVAGPGFYSTPGGISEINWLDKFKDNPHPSQFSSFEVAIIDESTDQFDVIGWQSREDINKIIKDNG
tara:strand:+ start:788 stop:1084 length:297 start_codon:yes stop_codon:yes gene_type:complete